MKLWIWSDLHLELQDVVAPDTAPEADVIVCAGDLCQAHQLTDHAWSFIQRYDLPMVVVPGNHEFYSTRGIWPPRMKSSDHALMKEVAKDSRSLWWRKRLYVLDDSVMKLGGVRFVGGTLWTDFRMDLRDDAHFQRRMQTTPAEYLDFYRIWVGSGEWMTPETMLGFHQVTRRFIRRHLATPFNGKTVVVTHHAPHPDCTPAAYLGRESNYLFACGRGAFEDVLTSDAAPALWVCGHTHHPSDVTVGRTRIVCNPHGYLRAAAERDNGFKWDLVIDTDDLT